MTRCHHWESQSVPLQKLSKLGVFGIPASLEWKTITHLFIPFSLFPDFLPIAPPIPLLPSLIHLSSSFPLAPGFNLPSSLASYFLDLTFLDPLSPFISRA